MKRQLNPFATCLCALLGVFSSNVSAADNFAMPPGSIIAGEVLEEYTNLWWQWAYSMNPEESAVVDTTGASCGVNQSGDVWYLAGGYGSSIIHRVCYMPVGKYVFFPVINMVFAPPVSRKASCEAVMRGASLNNDAMLSIHVEVDGELLSQPEQLRMKSPDCFNLAAKVPENLAAEPVYPSAADGFWVMLEPLSPGQHVIKFHAQYNRPEGSFGSMAQNIKYTLIVE
jgi:hypothetical protein